MITNGGILARILKWGPRGRNDLDSSYRPPLQILAAGLIPKIDAVSNQYGQPTRYLSGMLPALNVQAIAQMDKFKPTAGPAVGGLDHPGYLQVSNIQMFGTRQQL